MDQNSPKPNQEIQLKRAIKVRTILALVTRSPLIRKIRRIFSLPNRRHTLVNLNLVVKSLSAVMERVLMQV